MFVILYICKFVYWRPELKIEPFFIFTRTQTLSYKYYYQDFIKMNIQTIASVHIHHLRELIRANPQNSRELRPMVDLLVEFINMTADANANADANEMSNITAPTVVDLTEMDIIPEPAEPVRNFQMTEFVFSPNVTVREAPMRTMNNDTGIVELTMRPHVREQLIEENQWLDREQVLQRNRARMERTRKCARKVSRAFSATRLNQPADEECNVCMETPALKDMGKTVCGHSFCVACFDRWEQHLVENRQCATCPTCRRQKPALTVYVPRATPNANAIRA